MLRKLSLVAALVVLAQGALAQTPAGAPEPQKRAAHTKVLENEGIWVNKRAVAYVDDTPVRIFRPAAATPLPASQNGGASAPAADLWFVPANELLRSK